MERGITSGYLLREIHFIWERIARILLKDTDLNWTQMGTLGALSCAENHELSLKELEKKLGLTQSVVARMVRQMVEVEYVEYVADPKNQRVKRVRLLEKGLNCHCTFIASMKTESPPLLRGMSPGEALLFQELLERALENSVQFYQELCGKEREESKWNS